MVRKNRNSSWSGKVREFYFKSGNIDILKKSQGKLHTDVIIIQLNTVLLYQDWVEKVSLCCTMSLTSVEVFNHLNSFNSVIKLIAIFSTISK